MRSDVFEEVMVSTDDQEIANFAKSAGAQVPFMRSKETSHDHAVINEVIMEVLQEYEKIGQSFEFLCCIFPAAPFISEEMLSESFKILNNGEFDSVIPVVRFNPPIQRAFKVNDGKLTMFWPENFSKRTQDLEPSYHDAGLFYWMRTKSFLENKKCLTDNTGAIIIPENSAIDIDTENDWRLAELIFKTYKD